jgi:hypothetical protein
MVESESGSHLPRRRALLVVQGYQRLHGFLSVQEEIPIFFVDSPEDWQVLRWDLREPVLEPTHLHAHQVFQHASQSGQRGYEASASVLLRDSGDLRLDHVAVVVEERLEGSPFVGDGGTLSSVVDVRHAARLPASNVSREH